jgi:hypothetical protein
MNKEFRRDYGVYCCPANSGDSIPISPNALCPCSPAVVRVQRKTTRAVQAIATPHYRQAVH